MFHHEVRAPEADRDVAQPGQSIAPALVTLPPFEVSSRPVKGQGKASARPARGQGKASGKARQRPAQGQRKGSYLVIQQRDLAHVVIERYRRAAAALWPLAVQIDSVQHCGEKGVRPSGDARTDNHCDRKAFSPRSGGSGSQVGGGPMRWRLRQQRERVDCMIYGAVVYGSEGNH